MKSTLAQNFLAGSSSTQLDPFGPLWTHLIPASPIWAKKKKNNHLFKKFELGWLGSARGPTQNPILARLRLGLIRKWGSELGSEKNLGIEMDSVLGWIY